MSGRPALGPLWHVDGKLALEVARFAELGHRVEEDWMGVGEKAERRDVVAFYALTAFAALVYTVPQAWIPALAPLRLALLAFSGLALASMAWSVHPEATRFTAIELLKLTAIYLTLVNVVTTPRRLADVIGELGWVGLLFFLVFAGSAMGGVFAASRDTRVGWLARALSASVAGYLVCDVFSGYILSAHEAEVAARVPEVKGRLAESWEGSNHAA